MDFDFYGVWGKMREDFLRDNKPYEPAQISS